MTDLWFIIRLIAFVSGVFAAVSSLELLGIRKMYNEAGIMSRDVAKLQFDYIPLSRFSKPILTRFPLVLLARIPLGVLLIYATVFDLLHPAVVIALFCTDLLIQMRHTGGLSGAFDMGLVVNGGLVVATAFPESQFLQTVAVLFIAAQGLLSYFIAGVAKLIGDQWRDGTAVEMIFSTNSWGDDRIYDLIKRRPQLRRIGSWSVIGFECLFPVVLFVEPQFIPAVFGLGVLFHISNAVFMGINNFIFIFPATYPAMYYANELIRSSIL